MTILSFHHVTVLRDEAVAGLNIRPGGIYVDCTLGGAGHSSLIASQLTEGGRLIAIDQDDWALDNARERLSSVMDRVTLVKSNFRHIKDIVSDLGLDGVDGILFDLGVSSPQLDEGERGFSYNADAPLDMRMDQQATLSAYDIINEWDEEEIAKIIWEYGEEKFSRRIARQIVQYRAKQPVQTTGELVELIKEGIPAAARRTGPHPAKRTFQAIRIAVNDELSAFKEAVADAINVLRPEGRVSVITFHSLEDRICKQVYQEFAKGCTCPPSFPICACGNEATVKIITRKPILPSAEELEANPRARSAKLRVAEKR
ncbi:16S rRNA (cytosine(1402)-N(4))-methyltransferase RsmH [Brevibacillus choshinensis]|uniref:16S rRNA (cytosine(1402)-N(4))-methyltransferase RsmH n=1 Tax=Brevibacillus choshinensis TaxID=54911 RepID=UPI002E207826|nr:16S rRNA (cytosine(1402)-N(4))-methyltransferase RsmH [Brevibacillus choshinensis]MED4784551.1 16S rRNA (cytosine(1402)-N(4))-methyltransferase RsmH [Brevibacillus choshinensis]